MTGCVETIYSKALFEITQENKTSDDTLNELETLKIIFIQNVELIKLLSSPTLNAQEKQKIVSDIFKGKVSETVFNFINVIVDKGRISFIDKIIENYRQLFNDTNGILEITATTTSPLGDEMRKKLVDKLTSVSGKKITLVEKVDSKILGGIILNYGNTQLDASIKSRLDGIRKVLDSTIA